jgi:histidine triad (HIT) family protein
MATIFSKIIAGEIPCYKVAEDEKNFAFLDINPVNKGHVLVVPKTENDYIFNLSDDDYQSLTMFDGGHRIRYFNRLKVSTEVVSIIN